MSKPTTDELRLAFIVEVAAARRRINTVDRLWAKGATTPDQLADARDAAYLSMAMLRKLQTATIELDAAIRRRQLEPSTKSKR
jgi:hypothetical protein